MSIWVALEATELALFLKQSRWVYPLINAGHILGIGLLIGAIVPLDLRLLGIGRTVPTASAAFGWLMPFALCGLALAVSCGLLLFITQATDYVGNRWFWSKLALVLLGVINALLHLRIDGLSVARQRTTAVISLFGWLAALICGRMIGYS